MSKNELDRASELKRPGCLTKMKHQSRNVAWNQRHPFLRRPLPSPRDVRGLKGTPWRGRCANKPGMCPDMNRIGPSPLHQGFRADLWQLADSWRLKAEG
jgi:hypothetical protein